jgi:hypothetical protein
VFPSESRLLDWVRGTHHHVLVPAMSLTESHILRTATAKYSQCAPCFFESHYPSVLRAHAPDFHLNCQPRVERELVHLLGRQGM